MASGTCRDEAPQLWALPGPHREDLPPHNSPKSLHFQFKATPLALSLPASQRPLTPLEVANPPGLTASPHCAPGAENPFWGAQLLSGREAALAVTPS